MLNLHNIVRPAITANKPDEPFTVYRSVGQRNVKGVMTAIYAEIGGYTGQFQSGTIKRKVYLYAPDDTKTRAWSVYRKESRSGDFLKDSRGDYWLVEAVLEDFSAVGWECLRVTLQQTEPKITLEGGSDGG